MRPQTRKIILLLGDIILLYAALYGALLLRNNFIVAPEIWQLNWPDFSVVFGLWLIVFYIADFYELAHAKNNKIFIVRSGIILVLMTIVALAYFYGLPNISIAPKRILLYDMILTLPLLIAWRGLYNHVIKLPTTNCIILGLNQETETIVHELSQHPQWGYKVVNIFDAQSQPTLAPIPIISNLELLPETIDKTHTSVIIINDALLQSQEHSEALFSLINKQIRVMTLTKFYEEIVRKVPLYSISKLWFLDALSEKSTRVWYDRIKRLMDIVGAILGLVITLPLYPIFFLAIRLDSKGSFFYRHTRVGQYGNPFTVIKFRSMVDDAEKNGEQWTTKNDTRITRVGKVMRKMRLDELPQLMNILLGNMSFVGPRAERPGFTDQLAKQIPFFKQRLLVKPGLTGWAQVNYKYGESIEDALEKLQYDLFYIKNRSLYLDLSIILKTIRIVLTGAGQ